MNQSRTLLAPRPRAAVSAALLAVAGILAAITPAIAAPETFSIDPAHSGVAFSIRHLFSRVPGRFTKFEGKVVADRDDFTKSSVEVSIDAASIDTNEPARDKHLKSPDFFDAAKFAKLTFKSTKVTQAGPSKLSVDGNLTIRGVTKPVTLDVDVLGFGPGYGGKFLGGFEAKTKINRQDFGVAWNDLIEGGGAVLGDEVEIKLNVEAAREKAAQPAASPSPKKGR